MKFLEKSLRQWNREIISGVLVLGVTSVIAVAYEALKKHGLLIVAFCVLGTIVFAYLTSKSTPRRLGEKKKKYPKWHSWALVGLVTFIILGAGALTYRLVFYTDTHASEFGKLVADGDEAQQKGWYREALNYYQQALIITRDIGDRAGEGTTLTSIGAVYHAQGLYDQALEKHRQALIIIRDIGDRAGEGTTLNNIGAVYHMQGLYDQALESYQQALIIHRDVGDRVGESSTLNNIGLVYSNQGL